MRFTVLMPTYNRDYLIGQAIESVLDQTFKDFELLIIDDGSSDTTAKIVSDYKKIDDRIVYHKIPHRGLVPALNKGNELARGEIIVKADSDDLCLPNRLEKIANFFNTWKNTEFLYHGMYKSWESETGTIRREYIPASRLDRDRILKDQYIPGCFAYTKEFIQKHPYRQLYCSEDWMLILDAYFSKARIGVIDEGLYEYCLREDSNSLIHEGTGNYEQDELTMREILYKEYGIPNFKYASRK